MSFICGSFRNQEEDDYEAFWQSSPRKPTKRRQIFASRRNKTTTNPYSDRGRDKFEALLADLDQKRQKIFTQKGSEDVSMIKFIYKGTNEIQPIIVKLQDQRNQRKHGIINTREFDHQKDISYVKIEAKEENMKPFVDEKIKLDQCKRNFAEWWKPSYYFPLFVMLILVLLLFFGRSFTILCTSIGWYLVPVINKIIHNSKHNSKQPKKEYLKRSRRTDKKQ